MQGGVGAPSSRDTAAEQQATTGRKPGRVLVIPGLDGGAGLLMSVALQLFPGLRAVPFDHRFDRAEGGAEGLAERALAVLDTDGDSDAPTYVCGESFGGTVALTLARRHPDRLQGLILLSTFAWFPAFPSACGEAGLGLWRLVGDRMADWIIRCTRPLGIPGALGFRCSPAAIRSFLTQSKTDLTAYRAKCALSLRFDARPWLGEITCPTFILIGSWDTTVPTSAGRELARLIPDARLYRLPGGHLVWLVRADEAGQLISRWVAEISGPGVTAEAPSR